MESKAGPIHSETTDSDRLLSDGDRLLKERRYKEALEIYLKASGVDSGNGRLWHARAKAEVMCLKYQEAVESCCKAIDLGYKNADAYFLKSFSHGMLNQFQEALDSINLGLEIEPDNKTIWFTRGQYLYALGRLEESLTSFSKALKLSPDNTYLKEMTEKIKKWLARDGKSTDEIEKVMAFLQQGGNPQVISTYTESSKIDPRSVSRAFQKDYALSHLQNPEELLKKYEQTRASEQPQIILELSQKDFEFSRESWVEITLQNKGKTVARNLSYQFSSEVTMKHMDVNTEAVQQFKVTGNPEKIDLNVIPELGPGNQIKKFVSLTPVKLGQIALEARVSYTDIWNLKQTRVNIIWINVFKPGGNLPSINGYRLMWRLNAGESAGIYFAQRNSDKLKSVIKIPIFQPEQTALMQEFLTEIKRTSKLVHPYIVRIFQSGENPSPWFSMEYMARGNLSRQIGRLTTAKAVGIAGNLLDALIYARSLGITHRAVCAENVLLDDRETPKLTNWRIEPIIQKLRKNQTPAEIATTYYPPEKLIPGMGGIDWLTDIYQFGVLFFEMLTGRPPFPGKGDELIAKIKTGQPLKPSDFNPEVIQELDALVMRCFAQNKKDRYQEPLHIKKDLEKISSKYLFPQKNP